MDVLGKGIRDVDAKGLLSPGGGGVGVGGGMGAVQLERIVACWLWG